jgi:hypothetical protein
MQKRDVGSMDIESRALFDRTKNRGRTMSKNMELQHTLRDGSIVTLGFQ